MINDTLRMLVMQFVTNAIALGVGFGVNLTQEQTALVITMVNSATLLVAYFWKSGQAPSDTNSTVTITTEDKPA